MEAQVVGEVKAHQAEDPSPVLADDRPHGDWDKAPTFLRQQCGILGNGGNPDPAMSRGRKRL